MKKINLIAFSLLFIVGSIANGQINKASLSPQVKIEQQVGLANFMISYGKPGKKDRTIFGGLIPYGKVWRTGANSSTKFTVDETVYFNKKEIPAGNYALYTIPNSDEWTIIISKNTKLWGAGGYDLKDDLVRFKIKPKTLKDLHESFDIRFDNFHANGANLIIEWEYTQIAIPVFIDSDELVYAEINEKIINATEEISASTYYDAAQFYYEKGKELDMAVTWFDKAIELRPNAFWYVYYRAEIAYTLNDHENAKEYVNKCLKMAKNSPTDYGYIAKCDLLIAKLNNH